MRILLRKSVIPRIHNGLLEWNPGNGKWYMINYENVKAERDLTKGPDDPSLGYAYFRNALNKISKGSTEVFEGSYDPAKKILTIKKL